MNTALSLVVNNPVSVWEDPVQLEEIKKIYAQGATDTEFALFMGIGKATGLNPFLRELYCVTYEVNKSGKRPPALIMIGRDGYRKSAQRHPDYDYHQVDAVYENDNFQIINGEINHGYVAKDRGKLLGAYCIVKRHKSSKAVPVYVPIEEYSTGQAMWREAGFYTDQWGNKKAGGKPSAMIKKVAEAQALRMAFQELFAGTYAKEEIHDDYETHDAGLAISTGRNLSQTERLKQVIKQPETLDEETGEIIEPLGNPGRDDILMSAQQLDEVCALMEEKKFTAQRLHKALAYYKVDKLEDLTDAQTRLFILQLSKL